MFKTIGNGVIIIASYIRPVTFIIDYELSSMCNVDPTT
jgi:hypothetical protein